MSTHYSVSARSGSTISANRYCPTSGLMFRETIAAPKRTVAARASRYLRTASSPNGCASLQTTVLHTVLQYLGSLTAETFNGLPWPCAKAIWDMADKNGKITVNLWKAFAIAYQDEAKVGYYTASDPRPLNSLPNYISTFSCDNFQWVTCLTIANVSFPLADLINLSKLQNLVALDVQRSNNAHIGDPIVDDNVVRSWGRRAEETGGFSKLYVLILRNQRDVSAKSLQYLNKFPSLSLYGVNGCELGSRDEGHATKVGWTTHDINGGFRNLQREIELSHTRDSPIHSAFKHAYRLCPQDQTNPSQTQKNTDNPISFDKKPLLNFRIGQLSTDLLLSTALVFFRTLDSRAPSPFAPAVPRSAPEDPHDRGTKKRKLHLRASKQVDLVTYLASESQDFVLELRHQPVKR